MFKGDLRVFHNIKTDTYQPQVFSFDRNGPCGMDWCNNEFPAFGTEAKALEFLKLLEEKAIVLEKIKKFYD